MNESVIRRMTRLSVQRGAINLSQGFTDEAPPFDLTWGGIAALLGGDDDGIHRLETETLRALVTPLGEVPERWLDRPLRDLLLQLQNPRDRFNQYSFPFGLPELRLAIADYTLRWYGFRPDPETEITVVLGATEGISTVLRAVCDPGDGIIVFQPFHEMYPAQAEIFGLRPRYVTLREDRAAGRWAMDREELRRAVDRTTRAIIFNTPHNPTGKVFSEDDCRFVADLCLERDLLAITDEIYEHITYDGHRHRCLAAFEGMRERTLVVNAISKTGNATGWRVGWVLSSPAFTPRIRAIHDTVVIQAPTPLQKGAVSLLNLPEEACREIGRRFARKRDVLAGGLRSAGFQVSLPEGAYYLFADYRGIPSLRALDPMAAAIFLIEQAGVASVPGDNFYRVGNDGKNYLRFAFCRSLESLEEAVRRLKRRLE